MESISGVDNNLSVYDFFSYRQAQVQVNKKWGKKTHKQTNKQKVYVYIPFSNLL